MRRASFHTAAEPCVSNRHTALPAGCPGAHSLAKVPRPPAPRPGKTPLGHSHKWGLPGVLPPPGQACRDTGARAAQGGWAAPHSFLRGGGLVPGPRSPDRGWVPASLEAPLPTRSSCPKTVFSPRAEQFQRPKRNWYWHSLMPICAPSPITMMASGRLWQMARCRGAKPGILLQMMLAPRATTDDSALRRGERTRGGEWWCGAPRPLPAVLPRSVSRSAGGL